MRLYAFRMPSGRYCGFDSRKGVEIHTWTEREDCEHYTRGLTGGIVELDIGPDAPQRRDRPTCPGFWLEFIAGRPRHVVEVHVVGYDAPGQWFGPIPNPAEVTT